MRLLFGLIVLDATLVAARGVEKLVASGVEKLAAADLEKLAVADSGNTLDKRDEPLVFCSRENPGADYTGWYNECMDKMAGQWGLTSYATVGDWDSGRGCECKYASSVAGAWKAVREHLYSETVEANHACMKSMYWYNEPGWGFVDLEFNCYKQ